MEKGQKPSACIRLVAHQWLVVGQPLHGVVPVETRATEIAEASDVPAEDRALLLVAR